MQASVLSYHLHKDGGSADEYEDAFEVSASGDVEVAGLRVAISDGASESALAGLWARSLVERFVEPGAGGSAEDFARHAVAASDSWDATLDEYVAQREAEGRRIRWYEQPKLDRGAYATLLTVEFSGCADDKTGEGGWTAAAIGDCALFHVRDGELVTAFPVTGSAEFGTTPALLNSRNRDAELVADRVRLGSGRVRQQDDVYLCTDAVAAWFLRELEDGGAPWTVLTDLGTADGPDFAGFVAQERASGRMRNDDATLVHVAVW